jgi:hypothetical protein
MDPFTVVHQALGASVSGVPEHKFACDPIVRAANPSSIVMGAR